MKRIHLCLLMTCSVSILLISSCKKKDTTSTIVSLDKTGLNQAFAPVRSTPQNFSVTAGVSKKILGAEGTIISFYPGSFKDKNGNTITSGTINIQLIEMYKPGDMIANRATTATNTGLLTSGGQVCIKATKNGEEVFANTFGIGFKQQALASQPMELYYGGSDNSDSLTTWTVAGGIRGVQGTVNINDSSISVWEKSYYYFDSCTSFNMINCDHPYDSTCALIKIQVTMPEAGFTAANTQLAICYSTMNVATIFSCTEYNAATKQMRFSGYAPTGKNVKFVVMANKNGTYYFYQQAGFAADGYAFNGNVVATTLANLATLLKAL